MKGEPLQRRSFLTLLGTAAAAWPLAAGAQQRERLRRVGVLIDVAPDDPLSTETVAGFLQGLQELGWAVGRNIHIEYRWGAVDDDLARKHAADLVKLAPDVLFSRGGPSVRALQMATRSLPIVFTNQIDPVGAGTVASLARPGGNTTGFAAQEYGFALKWLELLKQIAPRVARVAVLRNPNVPSGFGQFGALQGAASSVGVELIPIDPRDRSEIERAVADFARLPNGGLIMTANTQAYVNRETIVRLAAQHRLPAVYYSRALVVAGGLISYGPVLIDVYRRAAGYVDRILKGEKPSDLPVQAPVKYETVLNLRTAKALGLDAPATVLVRADEVIE